jgi:hypothetical protein
MKTTVFKDGSSLQVSETPEEAEQLNKEHPNPFLVKRVCMIRDLLVVEDPHLQLEFITQLETEKTEGVLLCRDHSFTPPRVQHWKITNETAKYDDFVPYTANRLISYWEGRREKYAER